MANMAPTPRPNAPTGAAAAVPANDPFADMGDDPFSSPTPVTPAAPANDPFADLGGSDPFDADATVTADYEAVD